MRRALRGLALLALLLGVPAWLASSESGLRASLALAQSLLGERLAVDRASGRWCGPLTLEGLRWSDAAIDLQVARLSLDWQPSRLLLGRVRLGRVGIDGAALELRRGGGRGGDAFELSAPLPIELGRLEVRDLRVVAPDRAPLELPALELGGFWRGAWVHVEHLAFRHPRTGPVQAAGDFVAAFGRLVLRQARIEGPGVLHLKGQVGLAPGEATDLALRWNGLRWPLVGAPAWRSEQGQARLRGTPDDLRYEAQFAFGVRAQLRSQGRWSGGRLDAELSWTELGYPWLDAVPRWVSARGRAHVAGTPADYRWQLAAALAEGGRAGDLDAAGRGAAHALEIERARFAGLGGEATVQGRVAWSPQLAADARLRLSGIDPGLVLPGWPGRLNGALRLHTQKSGSRPAVDFELALHDSQLRGYALALDGAGRYADGALELRRLELRSGASSLRLDGRVTEPYDLRAQLDSPALDQLWPALGGQANVRLALSGPRAAPHLRLEGQGERLRYRQAQAQRLALAADLHPTQPSFLRADVQGLRWRERELEQATVDAEGRAAGHRLTLAVRSPGGAAELSARGALDLAQRRWDGELGVLRLAPRGRQPWALDAPAALALAPQRATLGNACLRAAGSRACGSADWNTERLRVAVDAERLELGLLAPWLPADWTVDGAVSGSAGLELEGGAVRALRADLHTTPGLIKAGTQARMDLLPSRLTVAPEGAELLAELDLRTATGQAAGQLRFAPGADLLARGMAGSLELELADLSVLSLATPEIAAARGRLLADFALAGSLREPLLDGELEIRDGELQLALPGITLRELGLEVTTARGRPIAVAAHATSGGGRLDVSGQIDSLLAPFRGRFAIKGRDVQVGNTPVLKLWVTPDLTLAVAGRDVEFGGELRVPKASLKPRELDAGVAPSDDQVLVGRPAAEREEKLRVASDVRMVFGDDVRFEGFGLKSRIAGELRVLDRPGRYTQGRGELRLEDGRYKAYGQELAIETGRLLFTGGPLTAPGLDLRAQRKPREDVTVGVRVRGTLEAPEFSLFSEPAMPQEQQLSWLVVGRPLEENVTTEDRRRISGAALSLGLAGGDFVAQRIGKGLRLDEVSLGAKPGESAEQARLTIGKYLSPRLFVSYGFGLFQPGQYFRLSYDLGRGFKLVTESGVDTGGDLLYTFER